jgi:hypothetical protein
MTNEPQLVRTYATPTAKALGLNVPQALHALASEKGEFISLLGAIIRRSCHSKFPISNTVFTRLLRWASHERASALRPETAHCRSLISHSRLAVSLSCASGLGRICS